MVGNRRVGLEEDERERWWLSPGFFDFTRPHKSTWGPAVLVYLDSRRLSLLEGMTRGPRLTMLRIIETHASQNRHLLLC